MIPLVKTFLPEPEVLMPKLEEVLYSGYIAQGGIVDDFEKAFCEKFDLQNCVTVNSGTAALHVALILAGVKEGDEVISTPITAEPTNTAIKQTGAKIVFADIDLNTGNLDPKSVEEKINAKTKAIMVVDYAGNPVDIQSFKRIEKKYDIPIIQDSAHALGAKYNGKFVGSHFKYTTFSFQAIKHMTTIDGGMLVVNDQEDFEKAKLIRWFGLDKSKNRMENDIYLQGYKYHMNNVNACIGLIQLDYVEEIISKYIYNGKYFDSHIIDSEKVTKLKYTIGSEPSYWLYTVRVKEREALIEKFKNAGVLASPLHKRNDLHSFLSEDSSSKLPNTNIFETEMLHIPCGWWVTEQDRNLIVKILNSH